MMASRGLWRLNWKEMERGSPISTTRMPPGIIERIPPEPRYIPPMNDSGDEKEENEIDIIEISE